MEAYCDAFKTVSLAMFAYQPEQQQLLGEIRSSYLRYFRLFRPA